MREIRKRVLGDRCHRARGFGSPNWIWSPLPTRGKDGHGAEKDKTCAVSESSSQEDGKILFLIILLTHDKVIVVNKHRTLLLIITWYLSLVTSECIVFCAMTFCLLPFSVYDFLWLFLSMFPSKWQDIYNKNKRSSLINSSSFFFFNYETALLLLWTYGFWSIICFSSIIACILFVKYLFSTKYIATIYL